VCCCPCPLPQLALSLPCSHIKAPLHLPFKPLATVIHGDAGLLLPGSAAASGLPAPGALFASAAAAGLYGMAGQFGQQHLAMPSTTSDQAAAASLAMATGVGSRGAQGTPTAALSSGYGVMLDGGYRRCVWCAEQVILLFRECVRLDYACLHINGSVEAGSPFLS
jgi:hypothetical protein